MPRYHAPLNGLPVGHMDDALQPQKADRGKTTKAYSSKEQDARIRVLVARERAKLDRPER